MSEQPTPPDTYSTDPDVLHLLGKLGSRPMPEYIDIATFRAAANADLSDRLAHIYTAKVPTFTGPAVEVLRWAEAKLAAADLIDVLAADLTDDVREVPERWRASVASTLAGGVVGFPPDGLGGDGEPVTPTYPSTPSVSHRTPGSLFPNPYDRTTPALWPW